MKITAERLNLQFGMVELILTYRVCKIQLFQPKQHVGKEGRYIYTTYHTSVGFLEFFNIFSFGIISRGGGTFTSNVDWIDNIIDCLLFLVIAFPDRLPEISSQSQQEDKQRSVYRPFYDMCYHFEFHRCSLHLVGEIFFLRWLWKHSFFSILKTSVV